MLTASVHILCGCISTTHMIPTSLRRPTRNFTRIIFTTANFLGYLKKQGWYDNSLIIVVGDHGEGLGEHHEDTHGIFLYDSTIHVPLIVKLPRQSAAEKIVNAQVRTTDILPTVLDVLGVSAPARLDGESLK